MVDKPSKPTGEWALKSTYYASDNTSVEAMTDNEYNQGRNMTGEPETLLGSIPNVHKEDWILKYITVHLDYIEQMLDYLDSELSG